MFLDGNGDVYTVNVDGGVYGKIQNIPEAKKVGFAGERGIVLTEDEDIIMTDEFSAIRTLKGYTDFTCSSFRIHLIDEFRYLWHIDGDMRPVVNSRKIGDYIEYCAYSSTILDNEGIVYDINYGCRYKLFEGAKHIGCHSLLDWSGDIWVNNYSFHRSLIVGKKHQRYGSYRIVQNIPPIDNIASDRVSMLLLGLDGKVFACDRPKMCDEKCEIAQIPGLPEITQIYLKDYTYFFLDINSDVHIMDYVGTKYFDKVDETVIGDTIIRKIDQLRDIALLPEHTKLPVYPKSCRNAY
jgi:hypothetical protein